MNKEECENISSSRPRRKNPGSGINRLNISTKGNYYSNILTNKQFLTNTKKNYPDKAISLVTAATEVMFMPMSAKSGINVLKRKILLLCSKNLSIHIMDTYLGN